MKKVRWAATAVIAAALSVASAVPAWGDSSGNTTTVTPSDAAAAGATSSILTVTFDTPLNSTQLKAFNADLASVPLATQSAGVSSNAVAGPKGAYLYCNHAYAFSDSNGTYSFQHACGGTTGPWGYRISAGVCDITITSVEESGMTWTRNGKVQGDQAAHLESCLYQFHGTYNPDHDYDFLTYADNYTFDVEVDGDIGSADLTLSGSFTSAGCTSGKACGN
jgi:hypothetical protein